MTEQKKDNRGYLYPNTNKTKPTQPDFQGKVTIEGKEWKLSAWENKSPDGKKYLSISVSPPFTGTEQKDQKDASGNYSQSSDKPSTGAPISNDLDELEEILRISDDDNPFN